LVTRAPKLGQNFLVDDAARHAIADALGDTTDRTVIEIGPGHGAITSILAARCRRLIAIEIDPALAAELRFRFREQPHVEIVQADVLQTDFAALVSPSGAADVVGNLPYYITSPILHRLFSAAQQGLLRRAVVMMQREVADRLAASLRTREYGVLSAATQMNAQVETLFTLPPSAFSPPPDVFSTVLRLDFRPRFIELGVDPAGFDRFLRACFAQKRKTLANNLRASGYAAHQIQAAWPAQVPLQVRAESLPVETLTQLCRALAEPPQS
jgi:16S rRNA (adenine1518-N6/adenine1519-N6)-dimethyltransferase